MVTKSRPYNEAKSPSSWGRTCRATRTHASTSARAEHTSENTRTAASPFQLKYSRVFFEGRDRTRGLGYEVLQQKSVGRAGSGQEVLEISRVERGRGQEEVFEHIFYRLFRAGSC